VKRKQRSERNFAKISEQNFLKRNEGTASIYCRFEAKQIEKKNTEAERKV
jgi:hypothetical protein